MMMNETLEEWVERIGQEPIWREVCVLIDTNIPGEKVRKGLEESLITELGKVFASDVFSLHWRTVPRELNLTIHEDIIRHADVVILSAKEEITKKVPKKEQLWRSLRTLYEETKRQKEENVHLQNKVEELKETIEDLRRPSGG